MRRFFSFYVLRFTFYVLFLLTTFSLLLTPNVFAQTLDFASYCQQIASDPPPQDFPDPQYRQPEWDELDDTPFKTTVTDTFVMHDFANLYVNPGAYGGNLFVSNLLLSNAKEVADYLEGSYLDEDHRHKDLRTLKSGDFQSYFGTVVKLTPQKVQDRLKRGYVYALTELGKRNDGSYKLEDITYTYTDVCNSQDSSGRVIERTILDLKQNWGPPDPPSLKESPTEEDWRQWRHTWGKYWPKIPLHDPGGGVACDPVTDAACRRNFPEGVLTEPPNMRSKGCLVFVRNYDPDTNPGPDTDDCPAGTAQAPVIRLGVPDLLRLNTLSRFTQQLLLPQRLLRLYFCKFRDREDFCEGDPPAPDKLGKTAPPRGEQGVGGTPVIVYDSAGLDQIRTCAGCEKVETVGIQSKIPYVGLTFGKLTSTITGTFKFFDPTGIWLKEDKYQQNSTKLPANITFTDTTIDPLYPPSRHGELHSEVRIWAGFLSGIRKSKNFVICTLLPSPHEAATCANENLQYNPVSR